MASILTKAKWRRFCQFNSNLKSVSTILGLWALNWNVDSYLFQAIQNLISAFLSNLVISPIAGNQTLPQTLLLVQDAYVHLNNNKHIYYTSTSLEAALTSWELEVIQKEYMGSLVYN